MQKSTNAVWSFQPDPDTFGQEHLRSSHPEANVTFGPSGWNAHLVSPEAKGMFLARTESNNSAG